MLDIWKCKGNLTYHIRQHLRVYVNRYLGYFVVISSTYDVIILSTGCYFNKWTEKSVNEQNLISKKSRVSKVLRGPLPAPGRLKGKKPCNKWTETKISIWVISIVKTFRLIYPHFDKSAQEIINVRSSWVHYLNKYFG